MDKETFLKDIARIDAGIEAFKAARRELASQYKEANKPFEIGEVVKIIMPEQKEGDWRKAAPRKERKAIVHGFEIDFLGNIFPVLYKIKKDGKRSEVKEWLRYNETVEKL